MQIHRIHHRTAKVLLLAILSFATQMRRELSAQQSAQPASDRSGLPVVEIREAPTSIDPVSLAPAALAKKVTVSFESEPLKKVLNWIQSEVEMKVSIDYKALAAARLIETEPISEKVEDASLYVLLSRLEMLGIAWYVEDKTLYITSRNDAQRHEVPVAYNVGDLLDAGYRPQRLIETINVMMGIATGDNEGRRVNLIGDVLFVRLADKAQAELAGLLTALRNPARRTFTFDLASNDTLRNRLSELVTVEFKDTAMAIVVDELSKQAKVPMRLDRTALAASNVRERTTITIKITEQKLSTALLTLHQIAGVSWYFRDQILWITSDAAALAIRKTAVFDVNDLCRDRDEADALNEAINKQARWKWHAGHPVTGFLESPKPGILVAQHTEFALNELLDLLESYRAAMRVSKSRSLWAPVPDAAEVVTGYYRLPSQMATDLKTILPKRIQPDSWKSDTSPQAIGEIIVISGDSKRINIVDPAEPGVVKSAVADSLILMITQTRSVHLQIGKLIEKLTGSTAVDREATTDTNRKPKTSTVDFGSGLRPAADK